MSARTALMLALLAVAACEKQDVIDNVSAGMRNACQSSRNCTVHDTNQTP